MVTIEYETIRPLFIELKLNCVQVGKATGFVISNNNKFFLITNWHVVTGRNPETGKPINTKTAVSDPDEIIIWHHSIHKLGEWIPKSEKLIDPLSFSPRWLEHPKGKEVDVV